MEGSVHSLAHLHVIIGIILISLVFLLHLMHIILPVHLVFLLLLMLFVSDFVLIPKLIIHGNIALMCGFLLKKPSVSVDKLIVTIFWWIYVLLIFLLFCFGSFQFGQMFLLKDHRGRTVAQFFYEAQIRGVVWLIMPRMKVQGGDSRSRLLVVGCFYSGSSLHQEVSTGCSLHV